MLNIKNEGIRPRPNPPASIYRCAGKDTMMDGTRLIKKKNNAIKIKI